MRIESPRFGVIEAEDEAALCFPEGLPGFPDCQRFIVMDHDRDTPLRWLQCIDRPEVAFLIVEPEQILTSYSVDVPPLVLEQIGWDNETDSASDVIVFVILNIEGSELSANLRAPVVVHSGNRRAIQMIAEDMSLPLRHPVAPS